MAIGTFSQFFYGFTITTENQNLNFDEGGGELTAVIPVGAYSLEDLAEQIKVSLDAASTLPQEYTVSVDRISRRITISAASNFDLLSNSGSQFGTSIWFDIGFSSASDKTGTNSYLGESGAGNVYVGQFPPQDYVAPGFSKSKVQPSVNESASGDQEIITFGDRSFIKFEFLFINNRNLGSKEFYYNPNGVNDALDWLTFATTKAPMEFMPDRLDPDTFYKVRLESTPESPDGTSFELNEETGRNLPGFYRTGLLTFRIL